MTTRSHWLILPVTSLRILSMSSKLIKRCIVFISFNIRNKMLWKTTVLGDTVVKLNHVRTKSWCRMLADINKK